MQVRVRRPRVERSGSDRVVDVESCVAYWMPPATASTRRIGELRHVEEYLDG